MLLDGGERDRRMRRINARAFPTHGAGLHRRGPPWRPRTVGQEYDQGLEALARSYGAEVAG